MPRLGLLLAASALFAFTSNAFAAGLDAKGAAPAIDADGDLVAVVLAEPGSLECATSSDGGVNFAAPVAVGKVAPQQMLGMRRGPQIAVRGKTIVIVTNNGSGRRVVSFRSTDAGKTWQKAVAIDVPAGRSSEGLMSVAATRDGFAVVFLELVDKSMKISLIRSTDDGKNWALSRVLYNSPDGHVCECCQPTITSDRAGNVTVMFRNWLGGNRDMYAMTSHDDGKTFGEAKKVGVGSWKLNACPMDGGGLTYGIKDKNADSAKSPFVVFRRESILYTARPGAPETKLAAGKSPVVAATADGPVLAWETQGGVTVRPPKGDDVAIDGAIAPVLTRSAAGVVLGYSVKDGSGYKTLTRVVWEGKPGDKAK